MDFLFGIFAGDHDKALLKWCAKCNAGQACVALQSFNTLKGEVKIKYVDMCRQLGLHKTKVSITAGSSAPAPTNRLLKRSLSKGDEPSDGEEAQCVDARQKELKRERDETWKNGQSSRKRFVSFSVCKGNTAKELQTWMESRANVFQFQGTAGKAYRVFLFSAELYGTEQAEKPWQNCEPVQSLTAPMDFLCNQKGAYDIILSFDGRTGGKTRREMAEKMETLRRSTELWIVYLPTRRFGRRVAWSQTNRELGWLSFPCPLVQIPAKEREGPAKEWSETTHEATYQRVPPAPWDSLPLISLADKEALLGRPPAKTPTNIFDCGCGLPMYWGERKTNAFWKDILTMVDAKMVVDLSLGSGRAARACLELGIEYRGICTNEKHQAWLANVLDRDACYLITK